MNRLALLLSLLALGVLGLTACGGGEDDQTTAASETQSTNDELAADNESWCPVGQYRLRVVVGDISCRTARRVILDLANNRLAGSWSCNGDGTPDVVCTKEPGTSSRIVIAAYFAGEGAPVEADSGTILREKEIIGRKANEWARLFATDALAACRYYAGGQPACERAACQRVGHTEPIRNCTPPSSEFRESFANATVERVVVDAPGAMAEFSNGESVQFHAGEYERWYITKRWIKSSLTRSRRG